MHGTRWDGIIAHYAYFRHGTRLQQVLRAMEGSVDLKADCSCLSFDNLANRVLHYGSSLDVAQIDQMLIHENFPLLQLVINLYSPEKSVCTLLYCGSQLV